MDDRVTGKQLQSLLSDDVAKLFDQVAEAMNQARPGKIIDDSEELVRDAAGEFRQLLFEKALALRGQREAFFPSGQPGSDGSLAE